MPTAPDTGFSSVSLTTGDTDLFSALVAAEGDVVERITGTVEKVIDGDTIILRDGRTLRYLGIDAPERMAPDYASSRELNRQIVGGREVVVFVPHVESRDRFSRLRAAVFVDSALCVNMYLVLRGAALIYIRDDDAVSRALLPSLLMAQNQAIDQGTGIWSQSGASHSEKVLVTRNRFHRLQCHHVSRRRGPIDTREKALRAGKSPCRTCKP